MSDPAVTSGKSVPITSAIGVAEFLAGQPPGARTKVQFKTTAYGQGSCGVVLPVIKIHCPNQHCQTECFFDQVNNDAYAGLHSDKANLIFYKCRHCNISIKIFALLFQSPAVGTGEVVGDAEKIGEWPTFGPPTPPRLNKLIGEDRDHFFKGRRAEIQGMGIGAFGYYRRVVERQKDRILSEILRVSLRIGASPTLIASLEAARKETQFNKAVDLVKDAIPDALKINGHNPLLLLHSALSEGLHSQSDEECLELATSIRVVLAELAEKLGQALKEQAELENAVSRLLNKRSAQPGPASEKAGSG